MTTQEQNEVKFGDLGINPEILGILGKLKLEIPTPIQRKSIPIGLEGKDLIGIAQTGTGKTFAFGIPMLQRLESLLPGKGLILVPTRELALQVNENLRKIGLPLKAKTAALIGGENIGRQISALRMGPHFIIATPGRLIDHLKRKTIDLSDVKILVLDEADMMFDMGFAPQIEEILSKVPKERQTMLFSATMPATIVKLATSNMRLPIRVEVAPQGTAAENVDQEMIIVKRDEKLTHLDRILKEYKGSVLVFSRTKYGAKALNQSIQAMGHRAAEIHSNRSFGQRREALDGFKSKKYRVLIATDIAARGIDVSGIELVINFDLPDNTEDYVHRIGRTGRGGHKGKAISFATPDQGRDIRDIERLISKNLNVTKFAELDARAESSSRGRGRGRGRGGNRGGNGRSFGGNKFGNKKFGEKKFGDKPFGNNRKKFSNNKFQSKSKSFGGDDLFKPAPLTDKQRFRASLREAEGRDRKPGRGPRQERGPRTRNRRGVSRQKPRTSAS